MRVKTPEYKKIICRLPIDCTDRLDELVAMGYFDSRYAIMQCLLELYLLWLNGEPLSSVIEQMFIKVIPMSRRSGYKKGKDIVIYKKIVGRLPANTMEYLRPQIEEAGFKGWYSLGASICKAFVEVLNDVEASEQTTEQDEDVNTMFREYSDWEDPQYIKPHRSASHLSVYDDLKDSSSDSNNDLSNYQEECESEAPSEFEDDNASDNDQTVVDHEDADA